MHQNNPTAQGDALAVFSHVRPRLFGIAYRMLGSAAEAEDILQDAWLRWQTTDRTAVLDPSAFLATVTTRLAINVTQSARSRKETYPGTWLPEPVSTSDDPHLGAERAEALSLAVLLLMERLSPTERAAYILREAFDYPYPDIAEILQLSEANARQLVSRARKHIAEERSIGSEMPDLIARQSLLLTFVAAAQEGNLAALEKLFAEDVLTCADGGGFVRAARAPLTGRDRVTHLIMAISSYFWTSIAVTLIEANGQPAALLSRGGDPVALATIEASSDGITHIFWHMRPSKLRAVAHLLPGSR